jgi:hypothetical protein
MIRKYVNNFKSLVIGYLIKHLHHISRATMMGIYDIFPAEMPDKNDPISFKKLLRD